jgi:methyl halide transferase
MNEPPAHPQHTPDFEARFLAGDTPWEDGAVAPTVPGLFETWASPGARVLEVGCGLGDNVLWLAQRGYQVSGCDISSEAIRQARKRARVTGLEVDLFVADILAGRARVVRPEVVLTRGVLHTFATAEGRAALASAIADLLEPSGLWFDVSGSADTPGDPPGAAALGYPRLTLTEIATAVEPLFEFVSVQRSPYGSTGGPTDFLAFVSVLRRRVTG